jgi:beta-ketodecanoyl-[acyl-carrier-protein] synthase
MCPAIPQRPDEALSDQAEMAVDAARGAMAAAGKTAADIDVVIVSFGAGYSIGSLVIRKR